MVNKKLFRTVRLQSVPMLTGRSRGEIAVGVMSGVRVDNELSTGRDCIQDRIGKHGYTSGDRVQKKRSPFSPGVKSRSTCFSGRVAVSWRQRLYLLLLVVFSGNCERSLLLSVHSVGIVVVTWYRGVHKREERIQCH